MPWYRRPSGSDVWHWCSNCSRYPATDYETSPSTPRTGELCRECRKREEGGDCR